MTRVVAGPAVALLLVLSLVLTPGGPTVRAAVDTLPERLTDAEFWSLSEQLSEPNGYFRSDNLISNEIYYPLVMTDLVQRTKRDGVYLGVGPEQNFNYIAAIRPKMVIITDIRRGNLHTHLMYKAIFELSADRAEFVGRLFTKKRPATLGAGATAGELISAYWEVPTEGEDVYRANLRAITDHLTKTRKLPLSADDLAGIEYVYYHFYWFGPLITYNSSSGTGRAGGSSLTNYGSLMTAVDENQIARSFLASEDSFKFLKSLEERNLIVPVVGNFGGPKALRAVGEYVRRHGAVISAFYLSNVEQYLRQDAIWTNFCANVATMPLDEQSTFIRSGQGMGGFGGGGGLRNSLGSMLDETRGCVAEAPPAQPR